MQKNITRGGIYYADLGSGAGSIQGGVRPVLILQNDVGNKFSPTVIVAPLTSRIAKNNLPVHYYLPANESGLKCDSIVLFEQIMTINKSQLKSQLTELNEYQMNDALTPLCISLDIGTNPLNQMPYSPICA